MSDLPEGWTEALLTDVAAQKKFSIVDGPFGSDLKLSDYADDGTVPVLTTKNLTCSYDPASVRFISREKYDLLKRSRVIEGDILIAKIGSIGRCSIYPEGAPTAIIPANLCKITVDEPVTYNRFLYWQIKSDAFQEKLRDIMSAIAQPAFSVQRLKTLSIALAPFGEQHRIVAKLEEVLGKVEACQKRLAKIPVIVKRFRQSVLAAACSGRLTAEWRGSDNEEHDLPHGWERIPLEALLEKGGIFDGPFGSNLKTEDYADSGVRVVRLENIGHLKFFGDKETYITKEKYGSLIKHTVGYGDIIFSSFIADEIRACLLPQLETKAIAKADCFCLRPDRKVVNRRYLTFQLVSQESYSKLIESVHGATRPRINTTQLRTLQIRICPLEEQKQIVSRVDALFKSADQIEARYKKVQAHVDKLTQSILSKAFRGELVPTEADLARREGRDYEPASTLLDRVLKDPAELAGRTKARRVARRAAK